MLLTTRCTCTYNIHMAFNFIYISRTLSTAHPWPITNDQLTKHVCLWNKQNPSCCETTVPNTTALRKPYYVSRVSLSGYRFLRHPLTSVTCVHQIRSILCFIWEFARTWPSVTGTQTVLLTVSRATGKDNKHYDKEKRALSIPTQVIT